MKRGVKKRSHENLSDTNIKKVIDLLGQDKPITKKEACEILNISYNTKRLQNIVDEYQERIEYVARRKKQNRGKPASDMEIKEIIEDSLNGEGITNIAKGLFRSPAFVRGVTERVGIPQKASNAEERAIVCDLPDECMADSFEEGEVVWSARYHAPAIIRKELSPEYVAKNPGLGNTDYEKKYGAKCYNIYVKEDVDSEDTYFSTVEKGGFQATAAAYDLGKLSHLEKYGVSLKEL